jgi:hypothetical protein
LATGAAIEDVMQLSGRELIGEGLCPRPVIDAHKGVGGELARQLPAKRASQMLWGERRENGIIVAATQPTGSPMPQPNDPGLRRGRH